MSDEVRVVLAAFPALVSSVLDGHTAAMTASSAAASAVRALSAGDGALAAARVRRAEALLRVAAEEQVSAFETVGIVLDTLYNRKQTSLTSRTQQRSAPSVPLATWNNPSQAWWYEKAVGLRWRLGELSDVLDSIRTRNCDDVHHGYSSAVRDLASQWNHVSEVLQSIVSWIDEWKEVAALALEGKIGESGVLVDQR